MKRAIASVCTSCDLHQKIDAAAFAGFQGIEILENDWPTLRSCSWMY